MEFAVTLAEHPRAVVVAVSGELDIATAPPFSAAVQAGLGVDLTAATFADSSACRALVQTAKACRAAGSHLEIVCPPGNSAVRRVLDLVGMAAVAPVRDGLAETAAGAAACPGQAHRLGDRTA